MEDSVAPYIAGSYSISMTASKYTFLFLLFFALYLSIQGWKLFGLSQTGDLTGGAIGVVALQTFVCVGAFLWVRRVLRRREEQAN